MTFSASERMSRQSYAVVLTDKYDPLFSGLTESSSLFGVVCYVKRGDDDDTALVRVMFYVFDGKDIYQTPVSGCTLKPYIDKSKIRMYNNLRKAFIALCRAIATNGLDVYGLRDGELSVYDLANGAYNGDGMIYGEVKRKDVLDGRPQNRFSPTSQRQKKIDRLRLRTAELQNANDAE